MATKPLEEATAAASLPIDVSRHQAPIQVWRRWAIRPRRLFFTASPQRALGETLIAGVFIVVLCGLITVRATDYAQLTNTNYLVTVLVGPLLALWCALRLRWVGHTGWEGALREVGRALVMSLVLGLLPLTVIALTYLRVTTSPSLNIPMIPPTLASPARVVALLANRRAFLIVMVLMLGILGEFFAMRVVVYVLRGWNRLRRRHLQWALTHAHLTVVVLAVAALALIGEVATLATSPTSALRALVPVGVLLTVAMTVAVAVVLPPSVLFSYVFARRTTRRLRTLAAATSALRAGDYARRVIVEGEDEVAELQENFNAMAIALELSVRQLEAERDRVAGLLRSRRELVASVSHELRTPVATLRGYLEYTVAHFDGIPSATVRQDFETMENEAARLQALIQDLFTLSRVEVGQLEMRCQPTEVGAVAHRVCETLAPLAWERGRVTVVDTIASDLPQAQADAARLEQVLHNLVHNALRHTRPGGIIALDVHLGEPQEQSGALLIEVRDTGEGIDPEALPHVFERFYRTEASRHNPESGSGLGLALVKELTEAMGGSVAVSSTLGEGTCFTLRLPMASESTEQIAVFA